jgi:hypothetical protein
MLADPSSPIVPIIMIVERLIKFVVALSANSRKLREELAVMLAMLTELKGSLEKEIANRQHAEELFRSELTQTQRGTDNKIKLLQWWVAGLAALLSTQLIYTIVQAILKSH